SLLDRRPTRRVGSGRARYRARRGDHRAATPGGQRARVWVRERSRHHGGRWWFPGLAASLTAAGQRRWRASIQRGVRKARGRVGPATVAPGSRWDDRTRALRRALEPSLVFSLPRALSNALPAVSFRHVRSLAATLRGTQAPRRGRAHGG